MDQFKGPKYQRGNMTLFPAGTTAAAAGGGDVVTLFVESCDEDLTGPATALARIRAYGTTAAIGEVWTDTAGSPVKSSDLVVPNANITGYQMKWETNAGDAPNSNSVAVSTWQALTSDFYVGWTCGDSSIREGSCLVSIRFGTGATIDTQIWDGSVSVSGTGK
jgi:hypothetical protein